MRVVKFVYNSIFSRHYNQKTCYRIWPLPINYQILSVKDLKMKINKWQNKKIKEVYIYVLQRLLNCGY